MMLLNEWQRKLKCFETGLDASLSLFLTSLKCSRKRSPSLLPVSPMYSILHRLQVMQYVTLVEVQSNRLVILIECFGPEMLTVFWMKGQALHRKNARARDVSFKKETGCSSVSTSF